MAVWLALAIKLEESKLWKIKVEKNLVDPKKRMQLVLNADTAAKLDSLSKKRQSGLSQIVRQAIQTEDFLQNEIEEGSKIIIQRRDGSFREIVLRG